MEIVKNFFKRYEKQLLLPEIGLCGQIKIMKSRVLCIGSGGLAATTLPYLAAAGIGTLGIADFDFVELSNLQRQTLFTTYQLAQSKALCAKKYLEKLNPNIHYKTFKMKLTEKNISNVIKNFDIIIDGTDNIKTKILINKAAVQHHIPMVYGAAAGYTGQITTFFGKNGPCYNCLYPKNTLQKGKNDACGLGVLGPLPGLIGCLQATECLNLILTNNKQKHNCKVNTLVGTLLTFDLRTYDIRAHKINKKTNCTVCHVYPKKKLISVVEKENTHITLQTYKKIKHFSYIIKLNTVQKSTKNKRIILLNYEKILITKQIQKNITHIHKKSILIILCKYGVKSKNVTTFLKEKLKFSHVFYINNVN